MSGDLVDYDVIIVGSGPAGLQAAVHAARNKTKVAVLGRLKKSSLYRAHVENYCCMDTVLSGPEILEQGRLQAEKFGAEFYDQDVMEVSRETDERFSIVLESGKKLTAWSLVLAMGISRNHLNVPGEKELLGKGVSYCVECDGNFFRGRVVVVVGDESAAVFGALQLLLIAREVHLVYQDLLIDERLQYQLENSAVIRHPHSRVKSISGTRSVEAVLLDSGGRIETSGVFIELGAKGALELAGKLGVDLDVETMKYISTNKKQETNAEGIYAAGDICGPPWQMAKAVGEGCVAGVESSGFAKRQQGKRK